MAKRKIVCITWVDAEACAGWVGDDDAHDASVKIMRTYGLLVRKDKHFVVHASTHDKVERRWSELGKIPLGMVKSIKVLAVVDE